MLKKSLQKDKFDELARLLTRERLKEAGVTTPVKRLSTTDPDLDALLDRARSSAIPATASGKATKTSKVSVRVVRRLAGVKSGT